MNGATPLGPRRVAPWEEALAMLAWWCIRITMLVWIAGVMYLLWLLFRGDRDG